MVKRPHADRDPSRHLPTAVACAGLVFVVLAVVILALPNPAQITREFTAGNIISDANFFNPDAMSTENVQDFLERTTCTPQDGASCLAAYRVDTVAKPVSPGHCASMPTYRHRLASAVISQIARACSINPEVILVLLQKEQSLITRPSPTGYQKATGYACPDTADCDKRFFGFFNQVYAAAWQFREYTLNPTEWRYHIGQNVIQYHPKASCGSSRVTIINQATANLYNYTPYQPNAQTRANPNGPAGDCSAYGNLNFWRIYKNWFGDPRTLPTIGFVIPCLSYTGGATCPTPSPFLPRTKTF